MAGAITGIGFIGAGVVLHGEHEFVRGVTSAAAIFATAAMAIVAGTGHLLLATITAGGILLVLELRDIRSRGSSTPAATRTGSTRTARRRCPDATGPNPRPEPVQARHRPAPMDQR